jgi:hypothetical protein
MIINHRGHREHGGDFKNQKVSLSYLFCLCALCVLCGQFP